MWFVTIVRFVRLLLLLVIVSSRHAPANGNAYTGTGDNELDNKNSDSDSEIHQILTELVEPWMEGEDVVRAEDWKERLHTVASSQTCYIERWNILARLFTHPIQLRLEGASYKNRHPAILYTAPHVVLGASQGSCHG